ncbi:peptide deformylase [Streptomyces sp. NPDC056930]|uniref:peptide deformylase n=1 Tax=Streptomyces sp. NPDC056930 TaxID=3345967 RepID=UPI003630C362
MAGRGDPPRPDQADPRDETGQRLVDEHAGLGARIVQHETDHLGGTLCLDRAELRSLATKEQTEDRWSTAGLAAAAKQFGLLLP